MGGQNARNSKHSGADGLSGFSQDEGLGALGLGVSMGGQNATNSKHSGADGLS